MYGTISTLTVRTVCPALFAALCLLASLSVPATETAPTQPSHQVSVSAGAFSIVTDEARLEDVLNELAGLADFTLHFPASLRDERITIALNEVSLETALERLLENTSFLTLYELANESKERRLAEVRVLSSGGQELGISVAASPPFQTTVELTSSADAQRRSEASAALRGDIESTKARAPISPAVVRPQESTAKLREKQLEQQLSKAQLHVDPNARSRALAALTKLNPNDARVRAQVVAALDDRHPRVRLEALTHLGSTPDRVPGETLTNMALSDSDAEVRALAVALAARSLSAADAEAVLVQAKQDKNMWVRAMARDALKSLR